MHLYVILDSTHSTTCYDTGDGAIDGARGGGKGRTKAMWKFYNKLIA